MNARNRVTQFPIEINDTRISPQNIPAVYVFAGDQDFIDR